MKWTTLQKNKNSTRKHLIKPVMKPLLTFVFPKTSLNFDSITFNLLVFNILFYSSIELPPSTPLELKVFYDTNDSMLFYHSIHTLSWYDTLPWYLLMQMHVNENFKETRNLAQVCMHVLCKSVWVMYLNDVKWKCSQRSCNLTFSCVKWNDKFVHKSVFLINYVMTILFNDFLPSFGKI